MLQPTQPTATTPAPAQGPLEYAKRCHNLWLFRYHSPLSTSAADLYYLLLFLWMQQGQPAVVLAETEELLQRGGFKNPKTLRTALAPLLTTGLLAKVVAGVKGKPGQYTLGPEPSQLVPKHSREFLPTMPEAPAILGKNYLESENILGNNSPQLLPTISDAGQKLPTIFPQVLEPQPTENTRQILPTIPGVGVLSSKDLINLPNVVPPPPTPAPERKASRSPAQVQAERVATNAAAAATFAEFLKAYEGGNTENEKAWKYWQKLTPPDWAAILAYLPEYIRYTTGTRLRWRKGNATFIFQKAWQQPDIITKLKTTFDAEQAELARQQAKTQPKANAHTQRSVTEQARRNAPAYKPGQGGSL